MNLDIIGSIEQLASVRPSELSDGAGRGTRIIDVCNGTGLSFTVCPDRGMDIIDASFKGIPVTYRSSTGYRNRLEYNPDGAEWLRTWAGGLLTTCGLRNVGPANGDFGQHGRISHEAAEDVGVFREWVDGRYIIQLRGVLREARMFGENLRLVRTLTTAYGDNSITIHDEVTNQGNVPDVVQILYHCNFGYPLVSPDAKLVAEKHEVFPRDDNAAKGLKTWASFAPPVAETPEQCFFHPLPSGRDHRAHMSIANKKLGITATVEYDTRTLPRMVQWKVTDSRVYVLGLEPTNCWLKGRTAEIADGTAQMIRAGQTIAFDVKIGFE